MQRFTMFSPFPMQWFYDWTLAHAGLAQSCWFDLQVLRQMYSIVIIHNIKFSGASNWVAQIWLNWDNSCSPGIVFHQVYAGYVGFLRINPCPWMIVVMFHPCPCKVLTFISYPHRFGAVQPLHMQGSYDLILTHAGFLCHLTLAHAGSIGFNPCPCRVVVMF